MSGLTFRVATPNFGYRDGWSHEFMAADSRGLRIGIARSWQLAREWHRGARTSRSPSCDITRLELHVEAVSPPNSQSRSWSHILRGRGAVRYVFDPLSPRNVDNDYARLFDDAAATEQHCRNLHAFSGSIGKYVETALREHADCDVAQRRADMKVIEVT